MRKGKTGKILMGGCDLRRLESARNGEHTRACSTLLAALPLVLDILIEDQMVLLDQAKWDAGRACAVKVLAKASKRFQVADEQYLLVAGRFDDPKRALVSGVERRGERNIKALATELKECFPSSPKLKACSQSFANFKRDLPAAEEVGFPVLRLAAGACSIEAEYGAKRGRYVDILQKLFALAVQVSDHQVDHTAWAVESFDGGYLRRAGHAPHQCRKIWYLSGESSHYS